MVAESKQVGFCWTEVLSLKLKYMWDIFLHFP